MLPKWYLLMPMMDVVSIARLFWHAFVFGPRSFLSVV